MSYIYMNHFIREKNNTEPVITVQNGKQRVYTDKVEILDRHGDVVAVIQMGKVPHAKHDVKVAVQVSDVFATLRFIDL